VADLWNDLTSALASIAGKWTGYAALGTFLLYLFGYLALRFELSMYGVATNSDTFDEKYLFAGCRFLVYLASSVPSVLLLVLVLAATMYLPYKLASKLVPASVKVRAGQGATAWMTKPNLLLFVDMLLSLALIQFVLRSPFVYGNLLLRNRLPEHEWINTILLTTSGNRSLYFMGLLGGVVLTGGSLLLAARLDATVTILRRPLLSLAVFLLAAEFLLLPVNYGILIDSQQLPRVSELSGDEKLPAGAQAWLVWENKEVLTYLVRESGDKRTLLTVPRKDAKVRIVADDPIFQVLFSVEQTGN
jgi:hypothetical protein